MKTINNKIGYKAFLLISFLLCIQLNINAQNQLDINHVKVKKRSIDFTLKNTSSINYVFTDIVPLDYLRGRYVISQERYSVIKDSLNIDLRYGDPLDFVYVTPPSMKKDIYIDGEKIKNTMMILPKEKIGFSIPLHEGAGAKTMKIIISDDLILYFEIPDKNPH